MIPEAVIAMLACARIGAVHSVVFGGFAAPELAARIDDAAPAVVVSASCGIEGSRVLEYKPILDHAIELSSHKPPWTNVILQRPQAPAVLDRGDDLDWEQAMADAKPSDCIPVTATDPLYILYTSGTTAKPKGVVRDNGGHAVALRWSMDNIYDTGPGEVFWAASDIGWVVGHSYIVYAPLLAGCTTVLYEGKPVGTPDAGAFWRVIAEHQVKTLFTAPTAFRVIKKEDPTGELTRKHDLAGFQYLFLAGERLDPETYRWARELLGIPVLDHWWQTETGWPIAADLMGLDPMATKPGSPTVPVPGYDVRVVDPATGTDVPPGSTGELVVRLPLPPGCLPTLWGDDQRFIDSYLTRYPGAYVTGDGGYRDSDGYLYVMGRTDDVINVAGHRLSTGEIEASPRQSRRRRRMRRHRRQRRAERPGPPRVRRAQGGHRHRPGRAERRTGRADPRPDRPGRGGAPGRHRRRAPQDPVGQDTAPDHARHRRRQQGRARALHHRRHRHPRRDAPHPAGRLTTTGAVHHCGSGR